MKFEFEWQISDPDPKSGLVHVRERLAGREMHNLYGPIPKQVADSFIKARRAWVHTKIVTETDALHVFEPRAQVISPTGVPKYDA